MIEEAKETIRKRFPRMDFGKLDPIVFSKKGNGVRLSYLKVALRTEFFQESSK